MEIRTRFRRVWGTPRVRSARSLVTDVALLGAALLLVALQGVIR